MATAITTVTAFREFMPGGASDFTDAQVQSSIDTICDMLERVCNRTFAQTTYRGWVNGSGRRALVLPERPATQVYRACIGKDTGAEIKCEDANATSANVTVHEGVLSLTITGGANDGTQTVTLATYATMAALKTAIEALSGDWSVTVDEEGAPQDVRPVYGAPSEYAYLYIPDNPVSTWLDEGSVLNSNSKFPLGTSNIFVWYQAGYATLPDELIGLVHQMTRDFLLTATEDGTIRSERIGDYSYTRGASAGLARVYSSQIDYWRDMPT